MRLADLPLTYRALLKTYPWRRVDPLPRAALGRPLSAARVALVTSAGLVAEGDPPFDLRRRGGDTSWRVIPHDLPAARVHVHHRSDAFDRVPLTADLNVVLPRARLDEAVSAGRIGAAAPRHLSFMGSITAPGRLRRETAPRATEVLRADAVDVALLVPV